MKTYLVSLILLCSLTSLTFGQRLNNNYISGAANTYSGEGLNVFDLRDRNSTKGSSYWSDEWHDGQVYLKDSSSVKGYALKYDLMGDVVEIQVSTNVKVLPTSRIIEFYIDVNGTTHKFINPTEYYEITTPTIGFFEAIYEGKSIILKKFELDILQPDYVPALDAGSLSKKIVQQKRYYWIYDGQLNIMPKSKSKMLKLMELLHPGVMEYAKEEKLNPKKEADFIELSKFCDK